MPQIKKVLFIIPPYFEPLDYVDKSLSLSLPSITIPYGILSIDAYVKSKANIKIKTEILDLNLEAYKIIMGQHKYIPTYLADSVIEKVCSYQPDIIGISSLFDTTYNYIGSIANAVKRCNKSALIIIGGGLPTNLYKEFLEKYPQIDGACYGEGEIPMLDLINAKNYYKLIEEHPSWSSRNTIKTGKIPVHSFVNNLDDIPVFDYSIINLNDYNMRSLDKRYSDNKDKREMSIHISRGCPYNCVFCSNPKLHGKKVRYMSVEKVYNEVSMMIRQFGLNTLMIEDDNFLADKERAKQILKSLAKLNIRIEFPNGLLVHAIDEEIGFLLKKAGATIVCLGVESGSDYVLRKIINKPLKASMIKGKVKILKNNGIQVHAFIIIGLPEELPEHRMETINMLNDVKFDWVHVFIATPIIGSRLYDICVKNNYLVNSDMSNHIVSKAIIKTPSIDPAEIQETAYKMNLYANFVNNSNMLCGNYNIAIAYFNNVIQKYPEHAIAHYFLSIAYEKSGSDNELIERHMDLFKQSVNNNKDWRYYAHYYKLAFCPITRKEIIMSDKTPQGQDIVWVQDKRWQKFNKPMRCRHMGEKYIVCLNMTNWALKRSNGYWAYCEEHMYVQRIRDNVVEFPVHSDSPAAKRGYTE